MRVMKYCLGLLVLLLTLAGQPSRAQAGGIPFLITHGDSIANLAPVPEAQRQALKEATGADVEIGYAYSYFGLFWLDIWTWGGKYCLYHDKEYWSLEPGQAATLLGVAENKLPKPLFYSYPPLLMLILVVGLLLALITIFVKTDEQKAELLLKDPRYAEALAIFGKRYDAAVTQLDKALGPLATSSGAEVVVSTGQGTADSPEAQSAPTQKADAAAADAPATLGSQPSEEVMAAAKATMQKQIQEGLQDGINHLVFRGVKSEEAAENLALLVRVQNAAKDDPSAQLAADAVT